MIAPAYKLSNAVVPNGPLQRRMEDAKLLAKEVRRARCAMCPRTRHADTPLQLLDMLEARVGGKAFVEAYSVVREQVEGVRSSRKRERAAEAVVNPELAAERKRAKNLAKRCGVRCATRLLAQLTWGCAGDSIRRRPRQSVWRRVEPPRHVQCQRARCGFVC